MVQLDKYATTALHPASERGSFEIAQALLAAGTDPKAADKRVNKTALRFANKKGLVDILQTLIAAGADAKRARP